MAENTRSRRVSYAGDLGDWLGMSAADNESDLRRLKRNLRLAREQELTARQRQLLHMRFEENMTNKAIAEALGLDQSTVSRTISRAQRRLYRVLRYGL